MKATTLLDNSITDDLAADTTMLASASALHVHLISAPFTPGPSTDFTALTEATFTGSTTKAAGIGAQQSFTDPVNNVRVVQMLEPAGGWHWVCTVAPGTPETIYGYALTDNANAVTYGSALFDTPIVVALAGDAIDIPEVRFTVPRNSLY